MQAQILKSKKKELLVDDLYLGTDPEFGLAVKKTGELVSAEGIIKGTKNDPFKFDEGFSTCLDNVLAEGQVPPVKTPYQFYKQVQKLIDYINSSIPEDLEVVSIASGRYKKEYLQTDNAQRFGCESSLNTWTGERIHVQPDGSNNRGAGFHLHCGYAKPSESTNFLIGRAMDLFLGVPSVLLEPKNDRRKTGYGCAGNIRHCQHGVEYRSLSGYFSSSRELIQWCARNTQAAIKFVNDGQSDRIKDLGEVIQRAINNEDKEIAESLIKGFKIKMPK